MISTTQKKSTKAIYLSNKGRTVPKGFESTLLWLHNIRSMHNVGSAFRSADAMGIKGIVLSGYTPFPPRAELSKTALGADETVEWYYFEHSGDVLAKLNSEKYNLVALEQTHTSIPLQYLDLPSNNRICLLLGNEISGVDEELLAACKQVVEIPQYGNKHSLNVSVAAGIALFALHELFRVR